MHPIEIREQHGNLIGELHVLLEASHLLMLVLSGSPDARLASASKIILSAAERLMGIAQRIG